MSDADLTAKISVIVPAYDRVGPLRYTLASIGDAAAALPAGAVEILLIDDGSNPPLESQLRDCFIPSGTTILRQSNQGSISARNRGIAAARGRYILFLDSDDLIHPDKLRRHVELLERTGADVSHDDTAIATLTSDFRARYSPGRRVGHDADAARLLLIHQPLPHAPVYRRRWVATALAHAVVPAERRMDAAGDVWLYYNLAPHPGKAVKVDDALTAIGPHAEARYSQHWEKLGAAALQIAEAFVANCPITPATEHVRRLVGQCSFESWRRLPRDYPRAYLKRQLAVSQACPRPPVSALGGPVFQALARLLGPERAGCVLRWRNGAYGRCRTLTDAEFDQLMASLPPPPAKGRA